MLQKTQGELSKLMDSDLSITGVMVSAVRKPPSHYMMSEIPHRFATDYGDFAAAFLYYESVCYSKAAINSEDTVDFKFGSRELDLFVGLRKFNEE
ncbi:hypothetical protein TIFTF001_052920 [Ficus carica]|uniref:Uncharacterized protein n=1 Tax=Ficus carica TaxID=3494 RepID=A0AA88JFS1_FICCA|nr:hypothetical protein TIFTF001_052920 [Ficus carica]